MHSDYQQPARTDCDGICTCGRVVIRSKRNVAATHTFRPTQFTRSRFDTPRFL
jgi:hypothetical protein